MSKIKGKIMRENNFLIKILILAGLFLFINLNNVFAAGGKISGKIVEKNSGTPVPGVNVQLVGESMGAASDLNGEYFILNVPPGVYSLRASIIGYKSITKTEVQVSVNHTTEIDFQMEETVLQINEDVVITAERPPVEKDETSTRHFVSAQEISVQPMTQLSDVLTTLPGIDNVNGQLTVRGGSIDQVQFLIDGVRTNNPLDYSPYTNINLSSIQELEIITGGFNAEYGQAQSGVFNIITKEGGKTIRGYNEFRLTPPGKPHFGTAFYDYSTTRYWENTHARHLQWWIDNPDQWVDPNGIKGIDPNSLWTPEQAYQNYLNTHQPLTDYTNRSSYEEEFSLGGPMPFNDMYFFVSGKYRTAPPITGNSFRNMGTWFDGTAKITFHLSQNLKLMFSGIYSETNTNVGMESMNFDFISANGLGAKYAYDDFNGYPESNNNSQAVQFTHVLGKNTFYQLQLSRYFHFQSQSTFPGDSLGWESGSPIYDNLLAVDEFGNPIPGAYNDIIGLHTTGYYYRGEDRNTKYSLTGSFLSQINSGWQVKAGLEFTYYTLDRFQEAKAYGAIEDRAYKPYEGAIYYQNKLEFEGLIMNLGVRYDFYNPNDNQYSDTYDPFDVYQSAVDGTTPTPKTEPTKLFGQISPRIGVSHPISENTVLHFSYGHFFQRANWGDYGEGTGSDAAGQSVSGILNTYLIDQGNGQYIAYNLGNRNLAPRKVVQYEVGVEHNINGLVADVTAYYKDYTKTVRSVKVITKSGGSYITTANGDYGDEKGIEISLRKPFTGSWSGYLNYTWSTGILGRSGDPTILVPPGSDIQVTQPTIIGDDIIYERPRVKAGLTYLTPKDFSFLFGIFSNLEMSLRYWVYYPNDKIIDDTFGEGGITFVRDAFVSADVELRKQIDLDFIKPAIFIKVFNAFNDKHVNLTSVKGSSPEDRVRFVNSRFTDFPEYATSGAPFPDVTEYLNLPRRILFGIAITF